MYVGNLHPEFELRVRPGFRRLHARAEQFRHCARRIRPALAAAGVATTLPDFRLSGDTTVVSGAHRLDARIRAHQQADGGTVRTGRDCLWFGFLSRFRAR